ncbi:hypothetical protein [Methylosinus sporium]|uniref:hypothetical protein n=1 Tax=Methylosinus sporium TaxID=428 RepID=UPI00383BB7A9
MTPTRRTVLAGLAAAPVARFPAIAEAIPGADPVLIALAEYREARKGMDAAFALTHTALDAANNEAVKAAEEAEEEPFQRLLSAEDAALEARPTTREGAFRLLDHVAARLASDHTTDTEVELAPDAIRAALAVLEREGRA